MPADFSLIVPTRQRLTGLRRLLDSLAATVRRLDLLQTVLVVDEDDPDSITFADDRFDLRVVVVPPGQTMGAINLAGYQASTGRYLMLLNDDVRAQTPGWDDTVRTCFRTVSDDIVMVHTNDLIFKDILCTFPIVSRTFCELVGGICPPEYLRYRIDDHIGDLFNLLGELGERRTVYLPDVIFEHDNYTAGADGERVYSSQPGPLAQDAALFDRLFAMRKEHALRLKEHIDRRALAARAEVHRRRLDAVEHSFHLRRSERLRVETLSSATTRVTVGVVTSDATGDACRRCLKRIEAHTTNHELIVIQEKGLLSPAALNRLLSAATTEHVALLHDQVLVGPGWLDGLLAALTLEVGIVVPLQQPFDEDACYGGVIFDPDGSGQHRQTQGVPADVTAIKTFCNPVLLLDRVKCGPLRFDESYQHYFYDLDFGLRAWAAGLAVVCTAHVRVRCLTAGPLPYGPLIHPAPYEADREVFCRRWQGQLGEAVLWPIEAAQAKRGWRRAWAYLEHRGPRALASALARRLTSFNEGSGRRPRPGPA